MCTNINHLKHCKRLLVPVHHSILCIRTFIYTHYTHYTHALQTHTHLYYAYIHSQLNSNTPTCPALYIVPYSSYTIHSTLYYTTLHHTHRGVTAASLREHRNLLKPIEQTLMCHVTLRLSLRAHIHLFVPALCKLLSQLQDVGGDSVLLQAQTVHTLRSLISVSTSTVQEQCHVIVSVVVHTLCRTVCLCNTLSIPHSHSVYTECIATLAILAQQIGSRILPFDSLILRSIERKNLDITPYRDVSYSIRSGNWSEWSDEVVELSSGNTTSRGSLYRINEVDETKLIGMHQSSSSSGGAERGLGEWYLSLVYVVCVCVCVCVCINVRMQSME